MEDGGLLNISENVLIGQFLWIIKSVNGKWINKKTKLYYIWIYLHIIELNYYLKKDTRPLLTQQKITATQ